MLYIFLPIFTETFNRGDIRILDAITFQMCINMTTFHAFFYDFMPISNRRPKSRIQCAIKKIAQMAKSVKNLFWTPQGVYFHKMK